VLLELTAGMIFRQESGKAEVLPFEMERGRFRPQRRGSDGGFGSKSFAAGGGIADEGVRVPKYADY